MKRVAIAVLLISDNAADARLVRKALSGYGGVEWTLRRVRRLDAALEQLRKGTIAAVLLDLSLPEDQSRRAFETLLEAAPLVPILLLADPGNEAGALRLVQHGAQDYLLREHLDTYWLPRILHSMIERKAAEDALYLEKERAQVTLNSIGDAVLSTDIAGNVTYLNKVAEDMTGWSCEEAQGLPLTEVFQIIDGTTREPAPNPMTHAIDENKTVGLSANCILIRRDGIESAIEDSAAPIHDRRGKVIGAVIVFHDIGMARSVVQKMAHMAQHDQLTGLPNRLLFSERAAHAIELARRHDRRCAVLFIDLDGFKDVNDVIGHARADTLLQSIAHRLSACVRSTDTVCRYGGDEFLVLLTEIPRVNDAARSAEKVLLKLAAPHTIGDNSCRITASIGISIYPDNGENAEALIANADLAMYQAKNDGRNGYRFFGDETDTCSAATVPVTPTR